MVQVERQQIAHVMWEEFRELSAAAQVARRHPCMDAPGANGQAFRWAGSGLR